MKFHFDGHGLNDENGKRILTFPDSLKQDGTACKIAPDLCEKLNNFDAMREALERIALAASSDVVNKERIAEHARAALSLGEDSKIP